MKKEDVVEFETGNHCSGSMLTVNNIDFEDLEKEEVIEFIVDMMNSGINSISLMRELLERSLENLEFDEIKSDRSTCEQCGDWNYYNKYKRVEDE